MHLNLPVIHQQKNNCNQSSRAGKKRLHWICRNFGRRSSLTLWTSVVLTSRGRCSLSTAPRMFIDRLLPVRRRFKCSFIINIADNSSSDAPNMVPIGDLFITGMNKPHVISVRCNWKGKKYICDVYILCFMKCLQWPLSVYLRLDDNSSCL
jgi:hypothetical protein